MSPAKKTIAALIVAAGRGSRCRNKLPKQYHVIGNAPVLRHTLNAFANHPEIDLILPLIHPDDETRYEQAAKDIAKCLPAIHGGATRQQTVRRGLEALAATDTQIVLIHDAARPFVSPAIISRVIAALARHKGAIAALPVTDTLKRVQSDIISGTCNREGLWRAQTPQAFYLPDILAAHKNAADNSEKQFTDDAAIAEWAGMDTAIIAGEVANSKITTAEDIVLANAKMSGQMQYKTGMGFDVHAFTDGDHITLCGVDIAHSHALAGHSDADVGLHALTDALLGAMAQDDIGEHFPPGGKQWAGASSDRFVRFAAGLVTKNGGRIIHVDITIICQSPKIAPHRMAMRQRTADILGIELRRVSIKATTTEGLGFTGRGEGIAAQAVASISIAENASGV